MPDSISSATTIHRLRLPSGVLWASSSTTTTSGLAARAPALGQWCPAFGAAPASPRSPVARPRLGAAPRPAWREGLPLAGRRAQEDCQLSASSYQALQYLGPDRGGPGTSNARDGQSHVGDQPPSSARNSWFVSAGGSSRRAMTCMSMPAAPASRQIRRTMDPPPVISCHRLRLLEPITIG